MTSTPERRKHSACMLRFRESCPFRKLRKNKCGGSCYVIQRYVTRCVSSLWKVSSISEAVARRWGCSETTVPLLGNPETCPQMLIVQPYFHLHHQQQDHSAMDADTASSVAGPAFSISQGSYTGPVPSASNLTRLYQSSLSSSDHSMEMDCCVDPETGERA